MKSASTNGWLLPLAIALSVAAITAACGSKEPSTGGEPPAAQAPPPAAQPAAAAGSSQMDQAAPVAAQSVVGMTWTPEALEELLAPIALYPDAMLAQVLMASTNPQEVLDAGNWLLQNQGLEGKALDEAALKVGFTPPIRALLQFPETVDMMCMQLDWTTELGQAFTADQQGVLDAVQRLRRQAKDVGNLKSSPQLKVETEQQNGQEVVTVSSPNPNVVYVPQYDPVAVYAPAPAATTTTVPATTTTTTTTTESSGHSTGALITTGLLAFGAGMLVNEVFDDDEDDYWHNHNYYYPNYGYGGMPYYPPYPYRPAYGNGYYPANGYNRPPNYQHGFNNNNVVVINNGQNNYWNDRNKRATTYQRGGTYEARSPITSAKTNRPELQQLNQRQPKPMPADVKRPSNTATASNWKGQSSYAGAKGGAAKTAAAGRTGPTTQQARPAPKVQGSYGGGASADRAKPTQGGYAGAQPARAKPTQGGYAGAQPSKAQGASREDRGYGPSQAAPRPQQAAKPAQQPRPQAQPSRPQGGGGGGGRQNAMAGSDRGAADRQASQRGKQSMPQGARSKGGGGGGGGGKKGKR